jgi:hypothetical protein
MHWSFIAMKRLTRSASVVAVALGLTAVGVAVAGAQMVNGVAQPPQKSGSSRQGIMVTPAPTPRAAPAANPSYPESLFPPITVQPVRPVQFTLVPAILMSDGSILANFGFGYEPVVRSCASAAPVVVVGGTPQKVAGNGVVIPNRGAPSQSARPQIVLSGAAQAACFTRDNFGRVFVYRRS